MFRMSVFKFVQVCSSFMHQFVIWFLPRVDSQCAGHDALSLLENRRAGARPSLGNRLFTTRAQEEQQHWETAATRDGALQRRRRGGTTPCGHVIVWLHAIDI